MAMHDAVPGKRMGFENMGELLALAHGRSSQNSRLVGRNIVQSGPASQVLEPLEARGTLVKRGPDMLGKEGFAVIIEVDPRGLVLDRKARKPVHRFRMKVNPRG